MTSADMKDSSSGYGTELDRLADIFRRIDQAYAEKATRYGFGCGGCDQTCCGERFYHHTLVENLYLERGISSFPQEKRTLLFNRADGAVHAMARERNEGVSIEVYCPLYTVEGCGLYEFRPLICRLHGLPYDYAPPGRKPVRGEGCHRFGDEIGSAGMPYEPFDRTPFFQEMAAIEIELRRRLGFGGRIRRTVAEMIAGLRRDRDRFG